MTIAHVPQLDATVAVWRAQGGWAAPRRRSRRHWRQTIVPHRTALDPLRSPADITRDPGARAQRSPVAEDQPTPRPGRHARCRRPPPRASIGDG